MGYPIIEVIRTSLFHEVGFGYISSFIGLENYRVLLGDPEFWATLTRTVVWTVGSVSLKTVIGLFGAILLYQRFTGRRIVRALILVPWIIPLPIGAYVWTWLYNGQFGLFNGILLHLGITSGPVEILAYPTTAFIGTLINDVWVGVPFMTLVFLAGLHAIPNELYEAARVDGANWWRQFKRITLPHLKTVLAVATLLSSIWTFNSFDIIWIQTGGGPLSATTTLAIQTYKTAFKSWDFGMGSTLAVVIFVILLMVAIAYSRFILRGEK